MSDKQALLLVNQNSRNGMGNLDAARRRLHDHGIETALYYPAGAEEMNSLIAGLGQQYDRIIIAGGDGTLSSAASGLLAAGQPFGILPMGTANDLARTLTIPADMCAAADVIVRSQCRPIDLGRVNDVLFFNAASIGLGTKVTRKLSKDIKGRWGILGYARSAWEAFKANRSFRAKIVCDDRTMNIRSIQIAVGNGRFYGGGMAIKDDAAISDQRLDLYSIKPQKFWKLLSLAPAIHAGQMDTEPYVDVASGREIEIYTRRPKSISTDGELTTRTPARFEVIPEALRVYVP